MRLFIAIELESQLSDELLSAQKLLQPYRRSLKLATPEQMHLTLLFLGEVSESLVPEVSEKFQRLTSGFSPFQIALEQAGFFPPSGAVRVIWAGIREENGVLLRCQKAVAHLLEEYAEKKENRVFSPHVTLARVREGQKPVGLRECLLDLRLKPLTQQVEHLSLIQSVLHPSGARYATLVQARLGS
jgi:RNA 2',3'-cyclic 3'-phosphodiesterase